MGVSRAGAEESEDSLMPVRARDTDWEGVRLHVVTGKGGTGKTTVAGALALALASSGGRVLLMEMEGRQGIAQLFDCPPLPYGERKVAVAPGTATVPGGDVYALAADVSGLAKVGPIRAHADTVQRVIRSPETAVHFVTVLEEMPVQETLDGIAELGNSGLQAGGIMINMVHPLALTASQLRAAASGSVDEDELALGLKAAGLDDSRRLASALAAELTEHARTVTSQRAQRRRLAGPGQPRYDLPMITDGIDLAGLYRIAAALRDQGAA